MPQLLVLGGDGRSDLAEAEPDAEDSLREASYLCEGDLVFLGYSLGVTVELIGKLNLHPHHEGSSKVAGSAVYL